MVLIARSRTFDKLVLLWKVFFNHLLRCGSVSCGGGGGGGGDSGRDRYDPNGKHMAINRIDYMKIESLYTWAKECRGSSECLAPIFSRLVFDFGCCCVVVVASVRVCE